MPCLPFLIFFKIDADSTVGIFVVALFWHFRWWLALYVAAKSHHLKNHQESWAFEMQVAYEKMARARTLRRVQNTSSAIGTAYKPIVPKTTLEGFRKNENPQSCLGTAPSDYEEVFVVWVSPLASNITVFYVVKTAISAFLQRTQIGGDQHSFVKQEVSRGGKHQRKKYWKGAEREEMNGEEKWSLESIQS